MHSEDNNSVNSLFHDIMRLYGKTIFSQLGELGLYHGQPRVLRFLFHNEGITQKELAKHLNVSGATVTKTVKSLERAGYIVKKTDTEDMRVTRLYIAEKGFKIKKDIEELMLSFDEKMLKGFSPEERLLFIRLLKEIKKNLSE